MRSNLISQQQLAFLNSLERWRLTEIFHPNDERVEVFYLQPIGHPDVWSPEGKCFFHITSFEDLYDQVKKKALRYDPEDNLQRWLKATQRRDQLNLARAKFQAEKDAWDDLVNQFAEFVGGFSGGLTEEALAFLNQPATEACYF